jgi:hypothetical protein
MIFDAAFISSK